MVILGITKLDSWLVSLWKEGIDYEETLAPMEQIHFDHGTSYKARMEDTPDGRGDSFLYGVVKTKCTWSSHWDLRHMTGSHMCTD